VPPFVSGDFVKIPKKRSQDFILPTVCFHIFRVSDKSIGLFLRYAFTSRYKEVLSKSHSSSMMTVPKFVPRLTKEETRVFESARESMAAFKKWRAGGVRLHKASILGRKRKTCLMGLLLLEHACLRSPWHGVLEQSTLYVHLCSQI